ncbi:TPA: hypothetical protein U1346_000825 [Streptococcus suis]|uniref:hypothetical protein n=1 Tax=Streptococcus suis TaxID=1307 RepID=UPI0015551A94|nr:hypothetical protein [Streptococcus suis]NQL54626.1 hypothetical protein [Streptococcus suis]NQM24013.1 hypothetical protein [Streptococcus suis]HEL1838512.1 hypothetical protein [Streptococcus suis]HEL2553599.1 hypothetical protein [Streptococcus suis]HEM2749400.1 hypothetical protein [Streptococcus suis]
MKNMVQFVCPKCYSENRIKDIIYYSPSKMRVYKPVVIGAGIEFPVKDAITDQYCDGASIQFSTVVSESNLSPMGIFSEDGRPLIAICKYCYENSEHTEIPEEIFRGDYKTFVIAGSKGVGKTELFTLMTDDIQRYGHKYFEGDSVSYIESSEEKSRRRQRIENLKRNGRLEGTANDSRESIIFKVKSSSSKEDVYSIYDAAGERFDDYSSSTLASHAYFKYAKGIFLLIDILQLSAVKARISPERRTEYSGTRNQDISSLVSNVTKIIRSSRNISQGVKISVPIAVILTKVDVILDDFSDIFDEGFVKIGFTKDKSIERIEQINQVTEKFLNNIGEVALLSQLRSEYSNIKFFTLSSRGLNFEAGEDEDIESFLVELPLIWLMKGIENNGLKAKFIAWLGGQ